VPRIAHPAPVNLENPAFSARIGSGCAGGGAAQQKNR
jgi:hypothetical protein